MRFVERILTHFVCLMFAGTCLALEDDSLWLPKRYESHYLDLVKAANVAESLERCVTVLEATIDLDQGTPEHPLYRILCRQENNISYNEMVDGLTFEPLTTPPIPKDVLDEREKRKAQLEKQKRLAEALRRKNSSWQLCYAAILDHTIKMLDRTWLTKSQPEPLAVTQEQIEFTADFNAKSVWGEPLKYRAHCVVFSNGELDLKLSTRKQ